eukprot:m.210240 g.210240  ORF g.210240 m.210240 type:complete len:67 (+) comp15822_c0_seq5:1532-1732(+)
MGLRFPSGIEGFGRGRLIYFNIPKMASMGWFLVLNYAWLGSRGHSQRMKMIQRKSGVEHLQFNDCE